MPYVWATVKDSVYYIHYCWNDDLITLPSESAAFTYMHAVIEGL